MGRAEVWGPMDSLRAMISLSSGALFLSWISADAFSKHESHATFVIPVVRAGCTCEASVKDASNAQTWTACCQNDPASVRPYIYVQTEKKSGSSCIQGQECQPVVGNNCTAEVKATLVFPANACDTSGGVTGPGIGTDTSPCQRGATPGPTIFATWKLSAPCSTTLGNSAPGQPLRWWCEECDHGQPATHVPALEYLPRLECTACTR